MAKLTELEKTLLAAANSQDGSLNTMGTIKPPSRARPSMPSPKPLRRPRRSSGLSVERRYGLPTRRGMASGDSGNAASARAPRSGHSSKK